MRQREPLKRWVKKNRAPSMGLKGKDQMWAAKKFKPTMNKQIGKPYPPVPREPVK